MKPGCPKNCSSHPRIIRFGKFRRKSDSKNIQRFFCKSCGTSFSVATNNICFGQKKRRLNPVIEMMILMKASQRRVAKLLRINRKTVARKIEFLGLKNRGERLKWLKQYHPRNVTTVQFDEMVTFEHSKCKPVSIALMVEEKTRKILDFEVSEMAANGPLAAVSREHYGLRKDQRRRGMRKLFERSKEFVSETAEFKSDEAYFYPKIVKEFFPKATHKTFKGRRGCVVGQGELKRGGYDPLFSLNHTYAMIRDGLGRLVRRTWCTTKKIENLKLQLEVYCNAHNQLLT